MKALVTGATGFTGGALCRRLVDDGWDVAAFVRQSSNTAALDELNVDCITTDITSRESVAESFPDVDVVFHIAAAARTELPDQSQFWRVNVDATHNLLEESDRHDIGRFVHCSTVGVHGDIESPPADETYRYKPLDHYEESKLAGEKLALEYFANGLNGTVVRPASIYGPGDARFVKLFKPVNNGYFFMIGSGESLYHMVYIDDVVEGFMLAATKPKAVGEIFTLAGERYTTLNELVRQVGNALDRQVKERHIPLKPIMAASIVCDRMFRAVGLSPPIYPRRVNFFQSSRAFSIRKARTLIDYKPRVGLQEGLRRTADWYKAEGLL